MVSETTNRSTSWLKGPFICYRCGNKFDNKYKHRRKIRTGSSLGRRHRAYFRMINFCPECNDIQIRLGRRNNEIMAIVILIIAVASVGIVLGLVLN